MLRLGKTRAVHFSRNFSLIMDPLRQERIAKSHADSNFPVPRLISFDLWGTLYTPKKPVPEQYYDISHGEFGIEKLAESIAAEFPAVFAQLNEEFPNYGKSNGLRSSEQWWLQLIARLYQMSPGEATAMKLHRRLMEHFEGAEAYVLYDDVKPVLEALTANRVTFVAATNSDYRARIILHNLGLGQYFSDDNIHLSYEIGYTKPDRHFYYSYLLKYYKEAVEADPSLTMTEFLERTWHVGDDYKKDFVGSVRAGCNGVYLDRRKDSVFLRDAQKQNTVSNDCFEGQGHNVAEGDDLVMLANNRVCVSGLQPLLRLFDI